MPTKSFRRPVLALSALLAAALLGCRSDTPARETSRSFVGASASRPGTRVLPVAQPPLVDVTGTIYEAASRIALEEPAPDNHASLHNVLHLGETIVSGSEPHGEAAFRILRDKGVKTILSVDGKVPDGELAERFGMRYVHVPIQYKGIPDDQITRIVKTFREQEGPFYVHCFHGKHRGPAAAAIGRLVLDGIPREQAIAEMRQWCGTSSSYEGLYASVAFAPIPSEHETRHLDWDFPSAEPLAGVAGAMVPIARASDHLEAASKNAWQPPVDHPDLSAPNEATMLADLFRRTLALEEVGAHAADFRGWMEEAAVESETLREAVFALESGGSVAEADHALKALSGTCSACHEVYRN